LPNCHIALRFGSQLRFHLQPRNESKLVAPLATATLSHRALEIRKLVKIRTCPVT